MHNKLRPGNYNIKVYCKIKFTFSSYSLNKLPILCVKWLRSIYIICSVLDIINRCYHAIVPIIIQFIIWNRIFYLIYSWCICGIKNYAYILISYDEVYILNLSFLFSFISNISLQRQKTTFSQHLIAP